MIKKRLKCAKNTNKIRKNSGMKFKKDEEEKGKQNGPKKYEQTLNCLYNTI